MNFWDGFLGLFLRRKKQGGQTLLQESVKERVIESVWDVLVFNQNGQAFHLKEVLSFDNWLDMPEIRRRIKELFNIEYKHDKSLYPYLKTMTDVGLLEYSDFEGKRHWRKRTLLLKR
jgi:hypothetical protein